MSETTTAATGHTTAAEETKANGARPEPQVHDPIHGASFAFEPRGESLWVYTWFEPGAHLPEHYHPSYEERWETIEGTARVKLAGKWRELTPADGPVLVERNVRHELRNDSDGEIFARTEVTPPGNLVEFLTDASKAAQEGLFNGRNMPTSLRGALWIAEFAHRFRNDTVMCSPPPALQRIVLPPLAALARRRR
jgi:quercetin dioxygenase-like cupin family protein